MKLAQFNVSGLEDAVPGFRFEYNSLGSIIGLLIPYIFALAGVIFLVYIVWAGLQLMLSRGDAKAIESAKGKITNGILGLLVVVFAYLIVALFEKIFNIPDISKIFG